MDCIKAKRIALLLPDGEKGFADQLLFAQAFRLFASEDGCHNIWRQKSQRHEFLEVGVHNLQEYEALLPKHFLVVDENLLPGDFSSADPSSVGLDWTEAQAVEWGKANEQMQAIVRSGLPTSQRCQKIWDIRWGLAKAGNLQARYSLYDSFSTASMTPSLTPMKYCFLRGIRLTILVVPELTTSYFSRV